MRPAIRRVLPVHEGVVFLAETVRMREDELQVLRFDVERRVKLLELRLVGNQIGQSARGADGLSVQIDRQPRVHVAVHPHAPQHVLLAHLECLQYLGVGLVVRKGAVRLVFRAFPALLGLQTPLLEERLRIFAVPVGPHLEKLRKRVHRLRAHTVHARRELEVVRIELAARVHLADAIDNLLERNAAPVVPYAHFARVVIHRDVDLLAVPHDELVDRVVDDFLHEDVNAIVVHRARTWLADIHTRTHTDMRHRIQRLDAVRTVIGLRHRL